MNFLNRIFAIAGWGTIKNFASNSVNIDYNA